METQRCLGNSTPTPLLAFPFFWQLFHGNSHQLVPQTPLLQYFLAPFFFLARMQWTTSYVSLGNHWNNLSIRVLSAPKLTWLSVCHLQSFPNTAAFSEIHPITHVLYCPAYSPHPFFYYLSFQFFPPVPFTNLPSILFLEFSSSVLSGLWKQHLYFILLCSLPHASRLRLDWVPLHFSFYFQISAYQFLCLFFEDHATVIILFLTQLLHMSHSCSSLQCPMFRWTAILMP